MRIVGSYMGLEFIQTYNGTEGWTVNPFSGSSEPQPFTADDLKNVKIQADMDGLLWNWKDKGYTVTLEGTEDVEGTPCFKIKVITDAKDEYLIFIDQDSYVMIRTSSKMKVMENEVESDTYYSNYKQFNGIAMPCNITNMYNGTTGEVIVIENVEMDIDMQDALFEKPVVASTTEGNKE
ncbi:MAG: outer membrane lipoprotein-sorting protein [Chitinophagales bacterium]